jgi:hypothetical protein
MFPFGLFFTPFDAEKFSSYPYFQVLGRFVFLAIDIAEFSNISHCSNPTLDIYN